MLRRFEIDAKSGLVKVDDDGNPKPKKKLTRAEQEEDDFIVAAEQGRILRDMTAHALNATQLETLSKSFADAAKKLREAGKKGGAAQAGA